MPKNNRSENFLQPRALLITVIVLAAAALRLAPHPMNFAPIGALALFGGAYFSSKREALAIPLLSLIVGDVFTGFHQLIPFIYLSFLVSVTIGPIQKPRAAWPRVTLRGPLCSGTRSPVTRSMPHCFSVAWRWPSAGSRCFANQSPPV